jgi:hypothetical protein
MPGQNTPPTNLQRLLGYLKPDSLAAKLVQAQMNPGAAGEQNALQKIIHNRLDELRSHYAGNADRQD